ncbi:MAG: histidine kinase [Halolamina sp.]
MSTETNAVVDAGVSLTDWQAGTVGGIVAAAVMAALISAMNPPTLAAAIPALYGLSGGVAGWVVHLSHGAVLGVAFVAVAESDAVGAASSTRLVAIGVVWGAVTWVVLAALVMPVWLSTVGFPMAPPLPNFAPPSLLWHVVYGLVVGVVAPALR